MSDRILIGVIVGAHGVRGEVKIKSFTAAARDVAAYGPVTDEAGNRPLKLKVVGQAKGVVVARIDGVADRNAAEALKGLRLYVARAALPDTGEDEYYCADLIGLPVERADGRAYGRILKVEDFGAGDVVEIALPDGGTEFLPLTRRIFPLLDPKARRVVIDPPAVVEAKAEPARQEAASHG
ncbi:MAG TPA: ribosome maturation factor RimM [Dongiaceae bacterium]|jgi:16S rRNA processing protein RimM